MSRKKSLWKTVCKNKVNYFYIAPFFICFFAFTVLPVLISIFLSFTYYNMLQAPVFSGLDNYLKMLFGDDIFIKAASNTMILAIAIGPVGYVASLLLAWMINDLGPKLKSVFVLLFYAPSISGNMYLIWKILFSDDANGYVNSMLMYIGVIDEPIYWLTDTKYMLGIVIAVSLWMSMGTGFLSFVAGLQGVDSSLLEAGSIDGIKNRWQELWFIIIPSMKPQLMFGAVMSITAAFSVGDVTSQLCGMPSTDYAAHTVVNNLVDYGSTRFQMGYASAIATVLFLVMLICNKLFRKLLQKVGT